MRFSFLSRLITPCVMFLLLIFCGQQGYVIFKDYKKVSNKLANTNVKQKKTVQDEKPFTLFSAAVYQEHSPALVSTPLVAEIEGIIRSDDAWLSFAVIKTPGGEKSYREGENLTGFNDAYIEEINKDNVVVNYKGTAQVLALKKPDYFKGDVESEPIMQPTNDVGADGVHLDDYLVLKPVIEKGQLEGYNINPRNTSSFYNHSGLKKGDVAVTVNSVDMTEAVQAKSILENWSKMKDAEVVVRRHAHLENIRVNVLNN